MSVLNVQISSFDELVEKLGDDKKMAASKAKALKIKTENKLSSQVKNAQIALIEANERFEANVLNDGADIVSLVKGIQDAQKTFDVYSEIYNKFFPNASTPSA